MANINQYGYEKIRSWILGSWTFLELRSPDGTVLKRFGVADGLTITGNATTQELEYRLVVNGDATFLGQTVGKSVLFDSADSTNAIATEVFTAFEFLSADDQLTVNHRLQVPQIV